jgi:quinol monooxygenase YgiN
MQASVMFLASRFVPGRLMRALNRIKPRRRRADPHQLNCSLFDTAFRGSIVYLSWSIKMPRVSVIVELTPKPNCFSEVDAIVHEIAEMTRSEPSGGCLSFDIMRALDENGDVDQSRIVIVQVHRDMATARAHIEDPRMEAFRARMDPYRQERRLVICQTMD